MRFPKPTTIGAILVAGVVGILLGRTSVDRSGASVAAAEQSGTKSSSLTADEWKRVVHCETLRGRGTPNPAWRQCLLETAPKTQSWENSMVLAMSSAAWLEKNPEDVEIKETGRALIHGAWIDLAARKGTEQQAWFIDLAELMIEAPAVYKAQSERRSRMFPPAKETWTRFGAPG